MYAIIHSSSFNLQGPYLGGFCPTPRHPYRARIPGYQLRVDPLKPRQLRAQSPAPADPATPTDGQVRRISAALRTEPAWIILGPYTEANLGPGGVSSWGQSRVQPATFASFKPRMYGPALGFLMFAVGINLEADAFSRVLQTPSHLLVGALAQWLVKPLLGVAIAGSLIPFMSLPPSCGTGIVLVSCVSGAQLSNYATYIAHPEQAPLSIVLTAVSTLCGAVVTPALIFFLLGKTVPVDAIQMALSIGQVVIVPVTAGVLCNKYVPAWVQLARPYVVFASLLDTCACVGASLSSNAVAARSILGLQLLIPVSLFHFAAFAAGHRLAKATIAKDSEGLARCISLETGMQSSLLALLLATKFFDDPLIMLPCGLSVCVMTLTGFFLVLFWRERDSDRRTAALMAKS